MTLDTFLPSQIVICYKVSQIFKYALSASVMRVGSDTIGDHIFQKGLQN